MKKPAGPNLFAVLKPYSGWILTLTLLTILANGLSLAIPKLTAYAIDIFQSDPAAITGIIIELVLLSIGIVIFTYLQNVVQTIASERVARDLRSQLSHKISIQEYATIDALTPSKLLTNLTSDVDAVKNFVAQAISSLISSIFLIIGTSVLLLILNWKLALLVIAAVPIIAATFFIVLGRVRVLFLKGQEIIDWLNKVISESILGAALIRLVHSHEVEFAKFVEASSASRELGYKIIGYFSLLIPVITFVSSLITMGILVLGGSFVINGTMSLGNFTAFNTYLQILIFPILIIGFMSNVIAQAGASYGRISAVLTAADPKREGTIVDVLSGEINAQNLSLTYGENRVLKDVSFKILPKTKNAIIGPTAAGKTQLLYLLTGLLNPTSGEVRYDGKFLGEYDKERFHEQVGFVFQDSIIFNLTLRENIAFSTTVDDESLQKAIDTAELHEFIASLPNGLDTVVSERGTSLSGGQKQRIMLARALALNPRILLLDDFTARVDTKTEQTILANVAKNYPDLTLISVTQKIAPIEHYDQIILLMEGELLAQGTHQELLKKSPEYVQIYESQKSTENYE